MGFTFIDKDVDDILHVQYKDKIFKYKLLEELEFTSLRKRMSIIVEDLQTGEIKLICKGADSFLYERCDFNNCPFLEHTKRNVDDYGKIGLRTLLLC